jgi:riboflavin kinase/FMN adenylyltransferase
MDVFEGTARVDRALRSPAIAVGNFDGVHLGHRHLLERAAAGRGEGGELVALTFAPHPAQVLAPERAPALLTTRARKLELLAAAGVDACVVEPFDDALRALRPADFAEIILARGLGARHVAIGSDFRFGRDRAGDAAAREALGARLGFSVEVVPPLTIGGAIASSSRVRALIAAGDPRGAAAVLGRPHDVDGIVVRGAQRGRTIGFPTANLETAGLLPAPGIYAVWVERGGERLAGAASLGTNPTFGAHPLSLEVYLLDFAGDLYDQLLRVVFVERLRGERRFADVPSLVGQIERDVTATRRVLAEG